MQFISGRIVLVEEIEIINKDNNQFSSLTFVIKKKMNKKMRNISFKCYGKLADEINMLRINDKVNIEYLIISNKSNTGTWYNPNYAYINNQNDTIPVFWQTFSDSSLLNLGLETIKPNLNYKIYPNPTSGFLYIELESAANQIKKIHIFDLLGKL